MLIRTYPKRFSRAQHLHLYGAFLRDVRIVVAARLLGALDGSNRIFQDERLSKLFLLPQLLVDRLLVCAVSAAAGAALYLK